MSDIISRNATLKVLFDGEIVELMIKTTGTQVYLDSTTTVSAKIAEMIAALNGKITSTDLTSAIDSLRTELKQYNDDAVAALVGTAPDALDTIQELAAEFARNDDIITSINEAIGIRAKQTDLEAHTTHTGNPHKVTKSQVGLGNVDNTADADKSVKYATSAGSADQAIKDGAGNVIVDTYAKKSEIPTGGSGGGSNIYASVDQPSDFKTGDLWFNITV